MEPCCPSRCVDREAGERAADWEEIPDRKKEVQVVARKRVHSGVHRLQMAPSPSTLPHPIWVPIVLKAVVWL